ncbi:hypothetical protein T459_00758 [Capsicum annuum]|uniref:Uncharacterized protein n=1 Tax=Capsicum annuum TaxID=4072 RepID=A0A2G3AF59_CAPAN|nr:hypothetical protein T459_00758 [Capsicum annuum]
MDSGDASVQKSSCNKRGIWLFKWGLVPQLVVECENHNEGPILLSDNKESKSSSDEDYKVDDSVKDDVDQRTRMKYLSKFLKLLDDHNKPTPSEEKEQVPVKETLPLVFRLREFEEVQDSPISKEGTVWDLVPLSAKATMYPHQHGAFEFV